MRKFYFLSLLTLGVFLHSCQNDSPVLDDDSSLTLPPNTSEIINRSGKLDVGEYSFNDVQVNPNLIVLNTENSSLESSLDDVRKGSFSINIKDSELSSRLVKGNSIYLKTIQDSVYLLSIQNVKDIDGNKFELLTQDGNLSDVFVGGSLNLRIDINKADQVYQERMAKTGSGALRASDINTNNLFNIFENIPECKFDGFSYKPNSSLKGYLNYRIKFGFLGVLPKEVETSIEIVSEINPLLSFQGALNQNFHVDLIDYVNPGIIDFLKQFEITTKVPAGGMLGEVDAKISLNSINMPINMTINVDKAAQLGFNTSSSFKLGYTWYGLLSDKNQAFAELSAIGSPQAADVNFLGEVLTDLKLIIKPNVTLIKLGAFSVDGDIRFGINTKTSKSLSATSLPQFGSEGIFTATGKFGVYMNLTGNKVMDMNMIDKRVELWKVGSVDTTFTISNVKFNRPSTTPVGGARKYLYTIIADTKYPVANKKITGPLQVQYEMVDINTGATYKKKAIIAVKDITTINNNTFSFDLILTMKTDLNKPNKEVDVAGIKNLTITDVYNYTGVAADVIIPVGSPFNDSFPWNN